MNKENFINITANISGRNDGGEEEEEKRQIAAKDMQLMS